MRSIARFALALSCSLSVPALVLAQPGPAPTEWDSIRMLGDTVYRLHTRWTSGGRGGRTAEVTVQSFGADFRPSTRAGRLYRGPAARAELATRDDGFAVVLYRGGASGAFVRAVVRRVVPPGGGAAQPPILELTRSAGPEWAPTNATICSSPEGYTVLWQEEPIGTAQARRARSFMALLGTDGRLVRGPSEVAIPWGFGAMLWNGAGYHLALFYDGGGEGQTRLNLVTLSPEGQPQQHPWWISDPQMIDEVHLLARSPGIVVVYRGGSDGTTVRSVQSSEVGSWGGATPPTQDLGRLPPGIPFTERTAGNGDVQIVTPGNLAPAR